MTTDEVIDQARQPERKVLSRSSDLIRRQVGRAKREFGLGMVGTLLYAVATVASAYVIGWATDSVLLPAVEAGEVATSALVVAALAILGVSAVRAFGIAIRRYGAYKAQHRLQQRDRTEITDRYLELPIEWHRRHPTGQLLSNVNADVEAASFIAAPLPMVFGVVLMLIATAVLLMMSDPFLAVVGFAVGPAIALGNVFYQRRMRIVAADAQRLRAEVAEVAHESFDAAMVVKTLGRETDEVHRFGVISDNLRDRMVEVGKLRAVFDPIMEALPTIGVVAIVGVGAWRVDQGLMTAGTLVTFAFLFRLVALPMRVFAWMLGQLPASIVGWERVEAVLGVEERFGYGSDHLSGSGAADAGAEDVGYLYPETGVADLDSVEVVVVASNGDRRGVDEVSLAVSSGKTIALVGPTGSGKSTVAQLMVRLFDPDDGVIRLDGRDVVDLDRTDLADSTALVFQDAFLFDDSIRENITLGGDFTDAEVEAAARLARGGRVCSGNGGGLRRGCRRAGIEPFGWPAAACGSRPSPDPANPV